MALMEQKQEKIIQIANNSFFFAAYTIWMFRAFFNTTYFYQASWLERFNLHALDAVWVLCVFCIVLQFRFEWKELLLLFLVMSSYWICNATGVVSFSVAVFLIYAARGISFRKIAIWTVVMQACLLAFVVTCSLTGVIENHIFWQYGVNDVRCRYGLGFLYCSYTSHYLLLFLMLYLVVRKRVRWYEMVLLLGLNIAGFLATDTKTDMLSLALMCATVVILKFLCIKKVDLRKISYLAFSVPFLFWVASFVMAKLYDPTSANWIKLNRILSDRLLLSHQALVDYPIHLFGQKIKWVGGSAMIKDPTQIYNYVDNNYISVMLQRGVLFTFLMCLSYGRALYISIKKNQLAMAAGLFVFTVVGLVNPEMRNLLYNTFMLVLLKSEKQFEELET